MDRSPILFRCDANPPARLGILLPVPDLRGRPAAPPAAGLFPRPDEPFPLLSQIVRGGNDYLPAGHEIGTAEDCDETIREVRRLGAAAVIVNAPGIQEEYLRELSSTGTTVVVIDSEAKLRFPNRLVINPLLGHTAEHVQVGTRHAASARASKYAIVRSVFRRQRALRSRRSARELPRDHRVRRGRLRRPVAPASAGAAGRLAGRKARRSWSAATTGQLDELRRLAEKNKGRLEVLTEPSEIGHPAAAGPLRVDVRRRPVAGDGMRRRAAADSSRRTPGTSRPRRRWMRTGRPPTSGPPTQVNATTLRDAVNYVLDDQLERVGMSRCARLLIDGRGPDRIVNGLEILIHAPAEPTRLRLAA